MNNRNIEDIDKLFREGLNPEDGHFTFPEGEWPKLMNRLDRYDRRKRGIFWIIRLSSAAALILLFFAVRMFVQDGQIQVVQQPEVHQKDQILKQQQEQPQGFSEAEDKKMITETDGSGLGLPAGSDREEKTAVKPPLVSVPEKEMMGDDTLGIGKLNEAKAITEQGANTMKHDSTLVNNVASPDQEQAPDEKPVIAGIEESYEKPAVERPIRKLALSVLAASDYNGVNNLNNASLGNDFGLLISFPIAKNWSLSTGGIYAKKLYETGYRNYNPAKDIWTEYYPRSVYADCRVLDIPLNVSYTLLKRRNKTISIGSGISSYIMLKEDYRFTYAETDSDTPLDYQVTNENQHWLSVLNFQATIEQRLNSRLSIGLQPYMKIPLSNIGFAGVKLQTLGMAANLNWNFSL